MDEQIVQKPYSYDLKWEKTRDYERVLWKWNCVDVKNKTMEFEGVCRRHSALIKITPNHRKKTSRSLYNITDYGTLISSNIHVL